MSSDLPPADGKKPRGRPAKYRSQEERQAARRAQVRQATRVWRDNQRAESKVAQYSLRDAGKIIDRVINNMLQLAQRVSQHPERYPQGFDELLQLYASDARSAAAHLDFVLQQLDSQRKVPHEPS
ncbi:hypothetical protein THUN1379_06030 [Paludibacterium sp. THUN1379]|uniref:hypothetical protein n=1 Tax=Paludibacterium sp. THUN1379 TaxID=3112107 RepID=UPI0030923114|nr:hypothetical protein THUN1379_06030 [Paludibacterium sp. THUN1379]